MYEKIIADLAEQIRLNRDVLDAAAKPFRTEVKRETFDKKKPMIGAIQSLATAW